MLRELSAGWACLLAACGAIQPQLAAEPDALAPPFANKPWAPEEAVRIPGAKATLEAFSSRSTATPAAIEPERVYDLPHLIDLAQQTNPETRAASQPTRAAAARLGTAEGAYLPQSHDGSQHEGFFSQWLNMVSRTQAEQPNWVTPLLATTPLLTQSFHYDVLSERMPDGSHLNIYGGGKGLEFIPTPNIEVILAVPPWEQRTDSQSSSGLGDWPSILAKYRLWSANEQQGDYAVTAFLQYTGSNGSQGFSAGTDILEPGLAFGKGWGRFDVQMSVGVELPLSGNHAARDYGTPVLATVVAQYQVLDYVWPEFGFNFTWWPDGLRQGRTQLFLTPGIVFGPFPLHDRLKLAFGGGYQFAVTPAPVYNGSLILSLRLYF
jgi:hypothetical protein